MKIALNIQKGFTLIELLIAIMVIGVLAVGAIVILDPVGQLQKTNDSGRKSDMSQIQKALETYHQDTGRYPQSSADNKIRGLDGGTIQWGSSWQPYMSVLPKDPSSSKNYVYNAGSDGQTYYIYASLDRVNDLQVCNGGFACVNSSGLSCSTGGAVCNYGVSSPNVSP